jgi:cell division protein FtsL
MAKNQPTLDKPMVTKHEKSSSATMQKPGISPSISVENNISTDENFVLLTSLITSILSFMGFIISSYHSMRGHRRDEELFNLQRERQRLELEKLQEEIRALQRGEM